MIPSSENGIPAQHLLLLAHRYGLRKRFNRLTAKPRPLSGLYPTSYNFARFNTAVHMLPAMACGLAQRLWDIGDIVKLVETAEAETA
jgi:hypothetical protein